MYAPHCGPKTHYVAASLTPVTRLQVFAIIHYGTLFEAIGKGLGASTVLIEPVEIAHAARLYFASRIFSLIAQCISKMSVLIFTRRIFSGNFYRERAWFQSAYTAVLLYGVCAVLLSSAGCRPQLTLLNGDNVVCKANIARWGVITALDVITEVILVALPIYFISKNTIKNSKKSIIVFIFAFRLLVAALSLAALVAYSKFFMEYSRISIGLARTVAWQQMLLAASLMTASIPCLKTFLDAFSSTGLMTVHGRNLASYRSPGITTTSNLHTQLKSQDQSQTLQSALQTTSRPGPGLRQSSGFSRRLRLDKVTYDADIQAHESSGSRTKAQGATSRLARQPESVESFRSDQLAIHRDVEFRVTRSSHG